MTFLAWLKLQVDRDDHIGDLAVDTFRIRRHPYNAGLPAWHQYLRAHGACMEAHEALDDAWKEYRATLPK